MNLKLKRIDIHWVSHPGIYAGVALGVLLLLGGLLTSQIVLLVAGGVITGVCIFLATKMVLSVSLWLLGLFGGLVTFVLVPNPQMGEMGVVTRLLATGLFSVLYMCLMDALLHVAFFLYNFFINTVGLDGINLIYDPVETQEAEAPAEEAEAGS
ncbi:MAG: hypothetical protein HY611_07595 [Elusimicrobia bacterium]|nr:hypothetical protein [Elusimicrobiota bacterium]